MLTEAYGEDCITCVYVLEWHTRFSERHQKVEDDEIPGRLSTSRTVEENKSDCLR